MQASDDQNGEDHAPVTASSAGQGGYQIGFAKPPIETRFKKGQSGNPAGRPRGTKSYRTILKEALDEKLPVKMNGRTRKLKAIDVMLRSMINQAVKGDHVARAQTFALTRNAGLLETSPDETSTSPYEKLADEDRAILVQAMKNWAAGEGCDGER